MNILFLQYGPVHEELAPPFVSAVHAQGGTASVILHPGSLAVKGDVFCYAGVRSENPSWASYLRLSDLDVQAGLKKNLVAQNIKDVIFLTLQDSWTVELATDLISSLGVRCGGVIHNVDKVIRNPDVANFWQAGIAQAFCLSRHVKDALSARADLESCSIFYSVFDPYAGNPNLRRQTIIANAADVVRLAVLGGVSFQSRDYLSLLRAVENLRNSLTGFVIRIIGGGRDRKKLQQRVNDAGLGRFFDFVTVNPATGRSSYDTYYQALAESDAVIALDGPGYSSQKITSAIPSAISFLKPLVLSTVLAQKYNVEPMSWHAESMQEALSAFLVSSSLQRVERKESAYQLRSDLIRLNAQALACHTLPV